MHSNQTEGWMAVNEIKLKVNEQSWTRKNEANDWMNNEVSCWNGMQKARKINETEWNEDWMVIMA